MTAMRLQSVLAKSFPASPQFVGTVVGVSLLAAVMAIAIRWRVSVLFCADAQLSLPAIYSIFLWQFFVWLPWIGYYRLFLVLADRYPPVANRAGKWLFCHILAAAVVAGTHLVWFWGVSNIVSPFREFPETRYGAFAFFFVFWFVIDVLVYGLLLATRFQPVATTRTTVGPRGKLPASRPQNAYTERFSVRKGRERHVVRVADILWIEAQGYYAALHVTGGHYLLRKSLTKLETELDPQQFIRVHRSAIVRVDEVQCLSNNKQNVSSITLRDGAKVRVSRSGLKRLRARIRPSN